MRKSDHSGVIVSIMEGPIDFGIEYEQINHYWYKDHYADQPEFCALIGNLINTVNSVKQKCEQQYDVDYGSIPNYYQNFHIGKWNKPYKVKQPKKAKKEYSYEECFNFAFMR